MAVHKYCVTLLSRCQVEIASKQRLLLKMPMLVYVLAWQDLLSLTCIQAGQLKY